MIAIILSLILPFNSFADNVLRPETVGRYVVSREVDEATENDFDIDESEEFYNATHSEYSFDAPSYDSGFAVTLEDYFLKLENKPIDVDSVPLDLESDVLLMDNQESPVLLAPLNNMLNNDIYKNTVVYSGSFGGSACRLVVPYDSYKSLSVVNGVLVNIGNTSISGRLLYGSNEISNSDYQAYSYIINPIYGNTSNVWRYGSFNYRRYYYLYTNPNTGSQSIQYNDTYGDFRVTDTQIHFATQERGYYLGLIALIIGGLALCLKRS